MYFGTKLYMFRAVLLPIIRSLFTLHSAMVYVIQDGTAVPSWSCWKAVYSMTYTIAECTVNKLLMMDRRNLRSM
jgi:hypothetical protein